MSMSLRSHRRRGAHRARRHLPRVAVGFLAVAGSGAGAFAALGSSAAFAGTNGQQLALVNPASDSVTFNLSGYNQYGQYSTQSVAVDGGQTVYDSNWWWQDALTVQETDNTTGEQTNFTVDVPAVQSGSDWFTVTGSAPAVVTLSSTPNPVIATEPVTLQATITPQGAAAQATPVAPAAGSVTFYQYNLNTGASTPLATVNVSNGTAALTTSSLPAGTDYWWASYSGDSVNLTATTIVSAVTVDPAHPSVQVSANPLRFGNVVVGTTVSKLLTVTNNGNIPWDLTGASTSSASFNWIGGTCSGGRPLDPGAACTFQLSYTPSAVGTQKGVIQAFSNFASPVAFNLVGTGVARPAITAISPKSGPTAGGTTVTITGTNLVGLTAAHVGSALATHLTCSSATSCTLVTPAGTGTRDITVRNAAGTSVKSAADRFTY